jgi:hypothetical protein
MGLELRIQVSGRERKGFTEVCWLAPMLNISLRLTLMKREPAVNYELIKVGKFFPSLKKGFFRVVEDICK